MGSPCRFRDLPICVARCRLRREVNGGRAETQARIVSQNRPRRRDWFRPYFTALHQSTMAAGQSDVFGTVNWRPAQWLFGGPDSRPRPTNQNRVVQMKRSFGMRLIGGLLLYWSFFVWA